MPMPLPNRQNPLPKPTDANPGLLWAKFFGEWPEDFSKVPGGQGKQDFITKFADTMGDQKHITKMIHRQKALVQSLGGSCEAYATDAPFVTGMGLEHPVENGFAWHHTLGTPYLPASSVKGLLRAWAAHWLKEEEAEIRRIFGGSADSEGAGSVILFDALPQAPVRLMAEVLTPHDGGWRQSNAKAPSDWHSPVPIPFLAVAPGAKFLFSAAPRPGAKDAGKDVEKVMGWLGEALEWLGAGAKTAVGLGRFVNEAEQKRNAPPRKGEEMLHDEWGKVRIEEIRGETALVNAIEEACDIELPISELKRP